MHADGKNIFLLCEPVRMAEKAPSGRIRRGYGKEFFQTTLLGRLHPVELCPEDAAEFNVAVLAFKGDLAGTVSEGGEAEPAGAGGAVSEDAVFVGFHDLSHGIVAGGGKGAGGAVQVFDFNVEIGTGPAVNEHFAAEGVAGIESEGAGKRNDFHGQAHRLIPALLFTEGGYDGLGVMNDELVFGGFPVGLRSHGYGVHTGFGELVGGLEGLLALVGFGLQRGGDIHGFAVIEDLGFLNIEIHGLAFKGVREDELDADVSVLLLHGHVFVRENHAEVGMGGNSEEKTHGQGREQHFFHILIRICCKLHSSSLILNLRLLI